MLGEWRQSTYEQHSACPAPARSARRSLRVGNREASRRSARRYAHRRLRATLTAHRDELLAIAWDDAAADAAVGVTLHRLRDVTGTNGDQQSADLWEAVNSASFARDRVAFEAALRTLESYTLGAFPPDAPAVLAELHRRRCNLTLLTTAEGGRELVIGAHDIPPRLLAASRRHRAELIRLLTVRAEGSGAAQ